MAFITGNWKCNVPALLLKNSGILNAEYGYKYSELKPG
jgi:hypothetical protein